MHAYIRLPSGNISSEAFGQVIGRADRLVEAPVRSVMQVLGWSIQADGTDLGQEQRNQVAREVNYIGLISCPLTDGSIKCSPIRLMKLSRWLGRARV